MSSNKRTWVIIGSVLVLIGLIMTLLYEFREIPDVEWKVKYDLDDKDPYGYWLFENLMKEVFDSSTIVRPDSTFSFDDYHQEKSLYVKISGNFNPDLQEVKKLHNYLERGNEALIITNRLSGAMDSIINGQDYYLYSWRDTMISVFWEEEELQKDSVGQNYLHYYEELQDPRKTRFQRFDQFYNDTIPSNTRWLATDHEYFLIYGRFNLETSPIFIHSVPELFSNLALRQKDMVAHLINTMSYFNPAIVILDDRKDVNSGSIKRDESPMDYVLSQTSLRWAYYLGVLTLLLYIVFRSRRRQRIIPLLESYDNTSLDHVSMIASLYESQQQHGFLINHMKSIFYQKMEDRYFISATDKDYVNKLSKKCKIPKAEIEILLNRFDKVKRQTINAYDMSVFYKTLERFYEKCA